MTDITRAEKRMTYRQAMLQKCNCGKFLIGGWYGDKKTGKPNFARISSPIIVGNNIIMCEEHTLTACFAPCSIPSNLGGN